jgi:RimJ/RimL family protein N-acetyltransferase
MPGSNVSKVKSYWKEYGALGLVKKAVFRILLPVFSYNPIDYYVISGPPQTRHQPRCPLEIRKGGMEDIDLIVEVLNDKDEAVVRKQIEYFFDKGGELFLAFSEGKLAHVARLYNYPGICEVHPLEVGPFIKLKEDEAYIGHCRTHPKFRGKNIYPVVLQHIMRYVAEKNKNRIFITVSPGNLPSIKGLKKAGFSFVSRKRMFKLCGKCFNNRWSSSDMIGRD